MKFKTYLSRLESVMKFKVYAGNMYMGKLIVYKTGCKLHIFTGVTGVKLGGIAAMRKVGSYKRLHLNRIM